MNIHNYNLSLRRLTSSTQTTAINKVYRMTSILFLCSRVVTLISFILILSQLSKGQLLTAEYLDAKLPFPNRCPRGVFNGDDLIYLLGGSGADGVSQNQILSLSVSTSTLQSVGVLPGNGRRGTIQSDAFGNMYYIGGGDGHHFVFKFDPVTNRSTVAASLPYNVEDSTSVKILDNNNTVYILGGDDFGDGLLAFDLELLTYANVSTLPFAINQGTSVRGNDLKMYIFDDSSTLEQKQAIELDLVTLRMMSVGPPTLPQFIYWPSSVFDGDKFAYIIGGYLPNVESDEDDDNNVLTPTGGIIQFDTVTFENRFLPVRNLPVEGLSYFTLAPAAVYVNTLNRIYFFGGQSFNYTVNGTVTHDDIFYIDLTPLSPSTLPPTTTTGGQPSTTSTPTTLTTTTLTTMTTSVAPTTTVPISTTTLNPDLFSCTDRPNGLYPHPTDCAMYIGCHDGELLVFSCPPPLLFDPVKKACDFPDVVDCDLTCVGKPDASYPHPHDCSLYIMCRSEVLNVFRCPPPLLFHPELLTCAFPEEVTCSQ
ncbi:uncharacterized protein LOC118436330 [Folsomia candida]|uniref:uncharacterized protein LOC118436330 n=1 Tax=Folsomia candida TaxID=158441 RepID=UPI0016053C1E|nr:uncharacterized protein LOC118436330 [Folsomia candida]